MKNEKYTNNVSLTGNVISEPAFLYKAGNMEMYEMFISVKRKNGFEDKVRIVLTEIFLIDYKLNLCKGSKVDIYGEFRASGLPTDPGYKQYVYAKYIKEYGENDVKNHFNNIQLEGYVHSVSEKLKTAQNGNVGLRVILHLDSKYPLYVNCILWGLSPKERDLVRNKEWSKDKKLFVIGTLNGYEVKKEEDAKEDSKTEYSYEIVANTVFM